MGNHLAEEKMPIIFYIPEQYLPSAERQASWTSGCIPALLGGGKAASAQSWLYQTWVELRKICRVDLVTKMPEEGIVVTLSNHLHQGFRARPGQFVAAVAADFLPHPGAQVQILQNPAHARRLPRTLFVPHWPQPGLVTRDPARGAAVRTAAFFGDPSNLARQVAAPEFLARVLHDTGVRLEMREAARWHDYSDVDIAIAIRDFTRARHLSKPATKLYNAWLAGVPLIGGSDSAFAEEGNPGTDFLVASSPGELLGQIRRLKENPSIWQSIVDAGYLQAAGRSRDAVRTIWQHLCDSEIPSRFEAWRSLSPWQQAGFWQAQRAVCFLDRKFRT